MKKITLLAVLFVTTGSIVSLSQASQPKRTTPATIKLAEAKSELSKANHKNVKNTLAMGDGSI